MRRNIRFIFNDLSGAAPAPAKGLTLAVRTDARHATAALKENIMARLRRREGPPPAAEHVEKTVHKAYQAWGHVILEALADCLDYGRYGLHTPEEQHVTVHFYNARALARSAIARAGSLAGAAESEGGPPAVYISLDEMIEGEGAHWGEIGFSRLFSLDGEQAGYLARPGRKPLGEQIGEVRDLLAKLKAQYKADIPFVLLEDNIRHARMVNWAIGELDKGGVFSHGRLAGIATCFCCASQEERARIRHNGEVVPVAAVVDYGDAPVDVVTPRDLLFEGYAVQVADRTSRLPAVFMSAHKAFKIAPDKADEFNGRILKANIDFCRELEKKLDVALPLACFTGADAISCLTGESPDTPMAKVLEKADRRAGYRFIFEI